MSEPVSRRDAIKALGAVTAAGLVPLDLGNASPAPVAPPTIRVRDVYGQGDIVDLSSTSEVFIPPRGRSFMKFSFDFPEPAMVFGDHRFGFLALHRGEHVQPRPIEDEGVRHGRRDRSSPATGSSGPAARRRRPGKLTATFTKTGSTIEWDIVAEMERPIKTVTTVIRDVPRGQVSLGGGPLADTARRRRARRLHLRRGRPARCRHATEHDDAGRRRAGVGPGLPVPHDARRPRAPQALLLPGRRNARFAWRPSTSTTRGARTSASSCPAGRLGHAATFEAAMQRAHGRTSRRRSTFPRGKRAPTCPRGCATSRWSRRSTGCTTRATSSTTTRSSSRSCAGWRRRSPADRVLVFLASWDGRYYWDYPNYKVPDAHGR